jgi:ubiquitin-conjugating enzyme E2 J2
MVEKQAIMRLNKEFSLLQKSRPEQMRACPSDRDTLIWYYVIHNLPVSSPYHGGQYFGKLVFPREYPLKPPAISMITPSGRFEVNTRLCLSMSDFHPESWNPSWRVETILLGLISFMTDESDPSTTGGIKASSDSRRNDALLSFFRNMRNNEFKHYFPDMIHPSKYLIGIGFSDSSPESRTQVRLEDLCMTPEELNTIQSIDDLRTILRHRGFQDDMTAKDVGVHKSIKQDAFAWLAVTALVGAWLYAQIKGT